ncbi:MAG TPA: glycosyltransferase family 2 protein [Ignavibacteria bacterium]|nr:glycosyltransferase family 2 protein [Ignavibacteria bacterium]
MSDKPHFWFAIPVHNRIDFTLACLKSIELQAYRNYSIVVCDDGSSDGTSEILSDKYPEITVLRGDGSLWWTGATNECVESILDKADSDDYIVTLNNDLELATDYLEKMVEILNERPEVILMSASYNICEPEALVEPGQRMDWLRAKEYGLDPGDYNYAGLAEVTHASGRGTAFPMSVFRQVGLFDFEGLPQYAADYDLAHRARRAGYRIYINYDAKLYSHVEATGSAEFGGERSLKGLYGYLTDIKSPACLKYRWRFARKNCPHWLLPSFIMIDTVRVVGSYLFKRRNR